MANTYRALVDLLPQRPLLVGDVTALDGDLRVITLPGGTTLRARGDASVGDHVFVRDGVIEGSAPALTVVFVEV